MWRLGAIVVVCGLAGAAPGAPGERPAGAVASGIAAQYPGDKGISAHPSVLLHEDFEDEAKVFDKVTVQAHWGL